LNSFIRRGVNHARMQINIYVRGLLMHKIQWMVVIVWRMLSLQSAVAASSTNFFLARFPIANAR